MKTYVTFLLTFVSLPSTANSVEKKPEERGVTEVNRHFRFEEPVRIEAGGKVVSVDSPGYACPTMADVDGDGKEDLVVGQFRNGNMQFCKNIAAEGKAPEFATAEWLKIDDARLEVPGVW